MSQVSSRRSSSPFRVIEKYMSNPRTDTPKLKPSMAANFHLKHLTHRSYASSPSMPMLRITPGRPISFPSSDRLRHAPTEGVGTKASPAARRKCVRRGSVKPPIIRRETFPRAASHSAQACCGLSDQGGKWLWKCRSAATGESAERLRRRYSCSVSEVTVSGSFGGKRMSSFWLAGAPRSLAKAPCVAAASSSSKSCGGAIPAASGTRLPPTGAQDECGSK
mmetsp:Transcript_60570/g.167873  ORF Transcript_60570/g.167873 Transcript_60570/m.167873 type:complete len:221 (-) Transcript_60570:29-691(-)